MSSVSTNTFGVLWGFWWCVLWVRRGGWYVSSKLPAGTLRWASRPQCELVLEKLCHCLSVAALFVLCARRGTKKRDGVGGMGALTYNEGFWWGERLTWNNSRCGGGLYFILFYCSFSTHRFLKCLNAACKTAVDPLSLWLHMQKHTFLLKFKSKMEMFPTRVFWCNMLKKCNMLLQYISVAKWYKIGGLSRMRFESVWRPKWP